MTFDWHPSDEAVKEAGRVLAESRALCAAMTPREQAEAAWVPGGPSVVELEALVRAQRGLTQARGAAQ